MAREWYTKKCRGPNCDEDIVFLRTKQRNLIPVNVVPHDKENFRDVQHDEYDYAHGEHEPHFATCPDAPNFKS